ncbi:hypothetical protein RMSM_02387 [Rhodopirellula maiorica SM1]|uniref:Uncharacterized protein n=1 Tax=Rhodopirellula maiorica SM1 TaxID=1265738 RepID=M5RZ62_9BACT|nr:hypothetical protein RMSM_02387 [Rhodopirellula maiorica SM1]
MTSPAILRWSTPERLRVDPTGAPSKRGEIDLSVMCELSEGVETLGIVPVGFRSN